MALTPERLEELCVQAERAVWSCGAGAPRPECVLLRDYGMYRLGDDDFHAIGITWVQLDGIVRSAKVVGGVVTDHYVIYGRDKPYFSAQIDPQTNRIIAKYKIEQGGYEPKVDPATGEVLQPNHNVTWDQLPQRYLTALEAAGFPYTEKVYCWADKPYGSCVEFAITQWSNSRPEAESTP